MESSRRRDGATDACMISTTSVKVYTYTILYHVFFDLSTGCGGLNAIEREFFVKIPWKESVQSALLPMKAEGLIFRYTCYLLWLAMTVLIPSMTFSM